MYDFTTAGEIDLGNGHKINLFGGKNYPALMMHLKGLNLGDVSNVAAFNTESNAQGFVNSSVESGANLFMPHSGTIEGSWQFQHSILEALTNVALTDKILSKKELIDTFNEVLTNQEGKKNFNQFKRKYKKSTGKDIKNFNSFKSNPSEIVELLNTENNYSPKLRKSLNDKLSANKKFQESIGVKNKSDFAKRMMDPMNKGVEGGELMGVVEFDNNTFEIKKTKPGDIDHHPSFGWTVLAKIKGIFQPKEFYQSIDVTDSYTKYNKDGVSVSKRTDITERDYELAKQGKSIDPKTGKLARDKKTGKLKKTKPFEGTLEEFREMKFDLSNVSSSAGSIPKVAKPKFQKSTSEDIEATKDYISQLNETPFLSGITSEEILKKMTDAGYDVDLETVNKLRNEALEVKSKAEPIKTKKTPKTVMARFIQSGLTEEEANRLARMAEKKQVSNEQRLAIIDKIEAEVGLDKAYELTSNPEANSIFSQETIDYFATAKADSLKKKAAKTESIKERNKLINQAAEIQTKLATEAERAGQITQFKNATYDRFPDMRISDTVVDTINKKTAEELR
jgi:hypothetical protein